MPEIPPAGFEPGEKVSSSPVHAEPPGVQWARCLSLHPRGEAPLCLCSGLTSLSCFEASERPKDHHSLWLVESPAISCHHLAFSSCEKLAEPSRLFAWDLLICINGQPPPSPRTPLPAQPPTCMPTRDRQRRSQVEWSCVWKQSPENWPSHAQRERGR